MLLVFYNNYSFGQENVSGPIVQTPVYFDISPPLRDMVKKLPPKAETSWKDGIVKNKFNIRPRPKGQEPGGLADPYIQKINGRLVTDTTIMNFDGNTNTQGYYPPDTHGDVGLTDYFQVVNCHYSIYNKATGALKLGPLDNSSVFTGLPNNSNDGDAVVLYDEQADRWLFSQFSLPNYPAGPFYMMIAVSQTNDPTGSWYRYEYSFTDMPDYPKFGVWGDGYYMSMHIFTATAGNYAGIGAVAYNRTLMLAGSPAATMIMFTKPSTDEAYGWLPSDCDGPFPTGNLPNYFLYSYDGTSNDHLGIYEFHVDWANTANSTFSNFLSLPVTAFTTSISGISQPGTSVKLDVLNDRMMYRLQYRKFSDHAAMVCNHTVDATSSVAGIRWYELRKTTGAWSVYQLGTYSLSDNNSRWMGSIAMDSTGNIALGYSVSGSNLYPSIRYTGRKKNDALNTMTIAEKGIYIGTGSQTGSAARWGDYSAMSCDPGAKATFWYTQEYLATTSATGWRTRIASFKFSNTPAVTTLAATTVTGNSATLNGTINPNGLATTYYFEWGTTTGYGNSTATLSAGSGSVNVSVSAGLAGLTPGSTYHFRLVGINSDSSTNGGDMSFTPGVATVTTTAATTITMSGAVTGGNVTSDGGSGITARGVCWATTANPIVAGSHTTDGSGTGTYTSTLTGLSSNTTYHIRAYATNAAGTVYGSDLTFTTLCGIVTTFPWNEGFENGGAIPNCWSQEQVSSSGINWVFITGSGNSHPAAAHGGTYNACLKDVTAAANKTRLITPSLNLTSVSSPQLKFWHTQAYWTPDQDLLTVFYKTSAGGTWTQLAAYTTNITSWTQETISLPGATGDYYIAFEGNAKYGYGVCVDDVQVSSSCTTTYPVSVSIAASANPSCQGTSVTYTATPVNGGTTPAYQWKVNGTNVSGATNVTYSFIPSNNNAVTCVLTSNLLCVTGNPATSNSIVMTVTPILVVGSISASQAICVNTIPALLNGVAPANGTNPVYQWQSSLNNNTFTNITGATTLNYQPGSLPATTYYRQLQNATGTCGGPLSTNTLTMTVLPWLPVSISITASANPVCAGTPVTFTATPVNGGTTPAYQWKLNGSSIIGATNATYSFTPSNANLLTCILTSGETCTTGNPATSNTISMTVNPLMPVSVSIAASANPVCAGTLVAFSATPVNGGTTPAYKWLLNGTTIPGATNATYSFTPSNGNSLTCVLASGETCTSGNPATSNTLTMTVNPLLPVSVSIVELADPVCDGTPVTFTATPVNGGTTPVYQWFLNGTAIPGATSTTYTFTPTDGNAISCVLNSGETCTSGNPATSNLVVMTVNPLLPVSVSIVESANPVCDGTPVTFTATPVNGGTTPVYQWFLNGTAIPGATSTTYTFTPTDGNAINCVLTSGETCTNGNPATSNTITMTVNPLLPVSVSISESANPVCTGTLVTFTANPVNGGTNPSYQWFLNSSMVIGATNSAYSFTPDDGNTISCVLTSGETCTTGNPATSNTITMTVNPLLPVSVSIAASANPVDKGTLVTFTAIPVNGGPSPVYQWTVNGTNTGTNSDTYAYIPTEGDVVSCALTSGETCTSSNPANSNTITMVVNAVPLTVDLQNRSVTGTECFDARQTITVAGGGTTFIIPAGGNATMIAGQNIIYYPGTTVEAGGYLVGYIAPDGPYCLLTPPLLGSTISGEDETPVNAVNLEIRIFPNPTTGNFTLELTGNVKPEMCMVTVYGVRGERVLSEEINGTEKHSFSLTGAPAGLYFVRVVTIEKVETLKIIKSK